MSAGKHVADDDTLPAGCKRRLQQDDPKKSLKCNALTTFSDASDKSSRIVVGIVCSPDEFKHPVVIWVVIMTDSVIRMFFHF